MNRSKTSATEENKGVDDDEGTGRGWTTTPQTSRTMTVFNKSAVS